jgi:hypothetical protein
MKTIKIGEASTVDETYGCRSLQRYSLRVFSGERALARQMQQWYLSWFQQNTSAECSAKAAVDECGQVAFASCSRQSSPSRPTERPWTGPSERRTSQLTQARRSTLDDKTTMGRLLGRLVVFFTTALIFFISYTPQIFIIWPWYGREFSIELFTLLGPFKYDLYESIYAVPQHSRAFPSILVGILLYNYYLCIVTDPGVVPHNWVRNAFPTTGVVHSCGFIQEPEFDDTDGYEVKKLSGAPRHCRMCKRYKPPRAHHCKTCKRYASAFCYPPI